MKKEDIKENLQLQVEYLEGSLYGEDAQFVDELIETDGELEEDMDNLLLLGIISGKGVKRIVKEIEDSKQTFLTRVSQELSSKD